MTDPNGPANMLATGVFWTGGITILVGIGKAFDRLARRRIRRAVSEALDNGDARAGDLDGRARTAGRLHEQQEIHDRPAGHAVRPRCR